MFKALKFEFNEGYKVLQFGFSAFYPSNETLNAWTHFIPFLLLLWKIVDVFKQLEDPFEEITFPLWIHSFGWSLQIGLFSVA